MALFVDVIVDISVSQLDRVFQYRVPTEMVTLVEVGRQVQMPFGNGNRIMKGFIVGMSETPSYDETKMKSLFAIDASAPSVEGQMIALADWMKTHNGCTMAQALKTVLPVKQRVKEAVRKTYCLVDEQKAQTLLEKSRCNKRDKARVRLLTALLEKKQLSREVVTGVLQISAATLTAVIKMGIMTEEQTAVYRNPIRERMTGWQQVDLNEEQQQIVDTIWHQRLQCLDTWCEADAVHLLHGVTGSGKTEVYMSLIEKTLVRGEQVIVLIPEISLTLQTVSRFYDRFGDQIAVMNSKLSAGERYDQYLRAKNGEASIMIGPRSALFTPFSQLGLIIIDEEHENAYKSETSPKYHAREAAIIRAKMSGAAVILGSATPSLTSYYCAVNGIYSLHVLKNRAKSGSVLPDVQVVDLREEFRMKNRGIISHSLHEAMEKCLAAHEQMMLFINRRGYAGFVSCRSCGYVMKCDHCEVSLTAHVHGLLKCHYCGFEKPYPKICPSCGSSYIAAFGTGTQKVEDMVKSEFPGVRVMRMDKDTTSGKDDMAKLLKGFSEGDADILIGTQMIVKGHDFENVTLVGVLAADLSMFSGDYLSSERTFQLLTQAAGRAGRGSRPGHVIIQTYQPEHYCITTAAAQDYAAFYTQEMAYRQMMQYPPYTQMLMVLAEGENDDMTAGAVKKLTDLIRTASFDALTVIGPTKAAVSKGKDLYRYVFYVKHKEECELVRVKDFIEGYLSWSGQFKQIYFNFDFNPVSLA